MHNAVVVIWNTKCGSLLIGLLFEVILCVLLDIFEMDSHIFVSVRAACLRIVDVRGIMGRTCAKQWGAHAQGNGLCMCKAMACAWRWLYLLANTSAPLKDQSLMLSLSCMDMLSPDKLSRLLLSMKPVQLNNLSASVLVAKTQRYFLASLHRLGNCGLLGLNQSKGSSPSSRAFSERSCLLLLC